MFPFHKARPSILGAMAGYIGTCVVLAIAGAAVWDCIQSAEYRTAEGTMKAAAVGRVHGSASGEFCPSVDYIFEVEGKVWRGLRYGLDDEYGSEAWAKEIVDQYKVGDPCTVYYDPRQPTRCALHWKPRPFPLLAVLIAVILAFGMLVASTLTLLEATLWSSRGRVWY